MPERQLVDLSHFVQQTLTAGRLKCIARLPVIAGDSFDFNSQIMVRLNQLRRPLAVDFKLDVFAFYCPYRLSYPGFVGHIEQGFKSAFTFPTFSGFVHNGFEAQMFHRTQIPRHGWMDYCDIWNNYFRDPSYPEQDRTTPTIDATMNREGFNTANLKSWGTAQSLMPDTDGDSAINVNSGKIQFMDIQRAQTSLRNEHFRDFYSSRYVEIMRSMSGVAPADFTDGVPELLWRESTFLNGYDINGTSGAQLGAAVGKGVGMVNLRIPRRLFAEHGTVYIYALMRMPPVFINAQQYLDNMNRPFNYIVPQAGDNFPPVALTMEDLFENGSSATPAGRVPAYEWYRDHPNFIGSEFDSVDQGWQYFQEPTTTDGLVMHGDVSHVFQSSGLRHAVLTAQHNIEAWRPLPSPSSSIMGDL